MMQPWQRSEPYSYTAGTSPLYLEEASRGDLYALSGRATVDSLAAMENTSRGGNHKDTGRWLPSQEVRDALWARIKRLDAKHDKLAEVLGLVGNGAVTSRLRGRYKWGPHDMTLLTEYLDTLEGGK